MYAPLSPQRNRRSVLGAEKYRSIIASSCPKSAANGRLTVEQESTDRYGE
jgi:hypothetical protein